MIDTTDTKDLERKAWRSVFQDGLWDIALGIVFLGPGLNIALNLPQRGGYLLYAAMVALSIVLVRIGKQRITVPRLGWVRFGPRGERRRRNAVIVGAIGVLLTAA